MADVLRVPETRAHGDRAATEAYRWAAGRVGGLLEDIACFDQHPAWSTAGHIER